MTTEKSSENVLDVMDQRRIELVELIHDTSQNQEKARLQYEQLKVQHEAYLFEYMRIIEAFSIVEKYEKKP